MKKKFQQIVALGKDKINSAMTGGLAMLSQVDLLKWSKKVTDSESTAHDKALDAGYLRDNIGGGDHRLFDGGHDVFSAWDRVKEANSDDTFTQEVVGYVSALWKDVTTVKGLPFATVDKDNFDQWVKALEGVPGLNREYLYDLLSFDAFEILSSCLGAAGALFALKREDQEKLAEILGSMGIISILSANPIMGTFVICTAIWGYVVKKKEFKSDSFVVGGSLTALSMAIFAVLGLPILLELCLVMVVTHLVRKKLLGNEELVNLLTDRAKSSMGRVGTVFEAAWDRAKSGAVGLVRVDSIKGPEFGSGIQEAFQSSLDHIFGYHDSIARLTSDLKRQETLIREAATATGKVIERDALKLLEVARHFLQLCREDTLAQQVPYLLAAVDYFVTEMDAIADFESYDGFDDDREVFEKVAEMFGLSLEDCAA